MVFRSPVECHHLQYPPKRVPVERWVFFLHTEKVKRRKSKTYEELSDREKAIVKNLGVATDP